MRRSTAALLILVCEAIVWPTLASAQMWADPNGVSIWSANPTPTCSEGGPTCTGGACVACGAGTYSTYADYATLEGVSGSAGDVAVLTNTGDAYIWVDTVGAYAVNMWLPRHLAARITGWVVDASGYPARIDVTQGDTVAALTSRGWTDGTVAAATTLDGAGYIEFTGAGTQIAQLYFVPDQNHTRFFAVGVIDVIGCNGTIYHSGGGGEFQQGTRSIRWTGCLANVNEATAWASGSTTQAGEGKTSRTAYEPFFAVYESSEVTLEDTHERRIAYSAETNFGATANTKITVFSNYASSQMRVKRLLFFAISP